jgi:hydrogenase maturation factor
MIGETDKDRLVTPQGAQPGDDLLLSKHIPIESVSIIAGEFKKRLADHLSDEEINQASNYLDDPGISVLRDVQIARSAGEVHAMHDPTEGGLSAALWELAEASRQVFSIDADSIPLSPLWESINAAFPLIQLDPMAAIASGALLLSVPAEDTPAICRELNQAGIQCMKIGQVDQPGSNGFIDDRYHVWSIKDGKRTRLPRPDRDEIARLLEPESTHA